MLTKFPSLNVRLYDEAFNNIRAMSYQCKRDATNLNAKALTDATTSADLFRFIDALRGNLAVMQAEVAAAGGSNLETYAAGQLPDAQGLASVYTTMVAAITSTVMWIVTNFPKDANGYLLAQTIQADGTRVDRVFTAAQLTSLRTQLAALIATID